MSRTYMVKMSTLQFGTFKWLVSQKTAFLSNGIKYHPLLYRREKKKTSGKKAYSFENHLFCVKWLLRNLYKVRIQTKRNVFTNTPGLSCMSYSGE